MIQTKTIDIEGQAFVLRQLPSTRGRAVILRLGRPIAAALKLGGKAGGFDLDLEAAARALTEEDLTFVCDAFADATLVDVVDDVAKKTHKRRLTLVQDEVFAGPAGYKAMWRWIVASIEWNFGTFTDVLGEIAGPLQMKATATSSPSTSTGSSDGS